MILFAVGHATPFARVPFSREQLNSTRAISEAAKPSLQRAPADTTHEVTLVETGVAVGLAVGVAVGEAVGVAVGVVVGVAVTVGV